MNILTQFRNKLASLLATNSMSLPEQFMRYGNRNPMTPKWSDIVMSDKDLYSGYAYAAIRNRAATLARVAIENVYTDTETNEEFTHPYLELLAQSTSFSVYQFWHDVSTFLDLEGVYYLLAVRAVTPNIVGEVQEFKLLNPYNIQRILSGDNLEVGGYRETRKGFSRDIPKEMIIEVRELNPFSEDEPLSMTDAAKESQFTLKTAGEYARSSLRNNINAPGIISTDVILEPEAFNNFKSRVKSHTPGEPIFVNGKGGVSWEPMATELTTAALGVVNDSNRDSLLAVAGTSKTVIGIEQSGTTRETAKVQKDLHIEGQILPRIQLIIDALNLDYRQRYAKNNPSPPIIAVDNPNTTDYDADIKFNTVRGDQFELYTRLLNKGYDPETAAAYVKGDTDIDQLGEPVNPPVALPPGFFDDTNQDETQAVTKKVKNVVAKDTSGTTRQQEGALKNAIVNVEEQLVMAAINSVSEKMKNQFEEEKEVVPSAKKKQAVNELLLTLTAFYGIVLSLKGQEVMRDRIGEFTLPGIFKFDSAVKKYIAKIAKKAAVSHVDTVSNDLYEAVREAALAGQSQQQIISFIKDTYSSEIVEGRAKVIARTETNRAFTRAQFEADRQFVGQNDLGGRAFKQWTTRSANPCEMCLELESEPPIPFDENFRDIGDDVSGFDVSYEDLEAGDAHPNCSCIYVLIIEQENAIHIEQKRLEALRQEKAEIESELATIL